MNQIDLRDAIGKTLVGFHSGHHTIVLNFGDAFAFGNIEVRDDDRPSVDWEPIENWKWDRYDREKLVRAGVMTAEEHERLTAEEDAEWAARQDAAEHAQYLELHKKYGGK